MPQQRMNWTSIIQATEKVLRAMEMSVPFNTPIAKLRVRPTNTIPTPKNPRINNLRKKDPTKQIAPIEKIVRGRRWSSRKCTSSAASFKTILRKIISPRTRKRISLVSTYSVELLRIVSDLTLILVVRALRASMLELAARNKTLEGKWLIGI